MTEPRRADIAILIRGLRAVDDLISQSQGVDGLHLNGDIAFWGELLDNEWLGDFKKALAELEAVQRSQDEWLRQYDQAKRKEEASND